MAVAKEKTPPPLKDNDNWDGYGGGWRCLDNLSNGLYPLGVVPLCVYRLFLLSSMTFPAQ